MGTPLFQLRDFALYCVFFQGEEVFNTYGEISSEEMLYLYGYAEDGPANPHEEVFIPSEYVKDVIYSAAAMEGAQVEQRWEYLLKRVRGGIFLQKKFFLQKSE